MFFDFFKYGIVPIILILLLISMSIYYKYDLRITVGLIITLCFILFFFRSNLDIYSIHNLSKNIWVSPSSSKITKINTSYPNYNRITTYLSPLDRHFQIVPVDSVVKKITRLDPKQNYRNKSDAERLRVTFQSISDSQTYHLDQIVSHLGYGGWLVKLFFPNRCIIFPNIKPGKIVKRGTKYGLIRFGSNMDYWIPKSYKLEPKVKQNNHFDLGDKVAII